MAHVSIIRKIKKIGFVNTEIKRKIENWGEHSESSFGVFLGSFPHSFVFFLGIFSFLHISMVSSYL